MSLPFTKLTLHETGRPVYVRLSFVAVVARGDGGEGVILTLPGGDTVWVDESVEHIMALIEP